MGPHCFHQNARSSACIGFACMRPQFIRLDVKLLYRAAALGKGAVILLLIILLYAFFVYRNKKKPSLNLFMRGNQIKALNNLYFRTASFYYRELEIRPLSSKQVTIFAICVSVPRGL